MLIICRLALFCLFTPLAAHVLIQTTELLYGEDYTPCWVPITLLKIDPSQERLFFSLAKNTEEKGGMHYDQISIYRTLKNGERLYATTDPDTMRADLLTLKEHVASFKKTYPVAEVFACSSYGNLIMDGFLGGYSEGQIIMRDDEPPDRSYFSLVVSQEGGIQFQDICYTKGLFPKETQIISGQAVVRNGTPVRASSIFEQFDNIKHLFHLPFLHAEGRTLHFAVDQLTADQAILKRAASGQQVILKLKAYQLGKEDNLPIYADVSQDLLKKALREKGYHEVASFQEVLQPGQYSILEGHISICFLPALNAHHFIALDQAGCLIDLIVQGKSNREGISLEKAGEWLIERFDVQDAIVIDNGGDCMLSYQDQLVAPSFNNRSKIASAIIYTTTSKNETLYRKNLKNRFLATSAFHHNSNEPPFQNPDSSSFFGISAPSTHTYYGDSEINFFLNESKALTVTIETKNLYMRSVTNSEKDCESYVSLFGDPDVMSKVSTGKTLSREETLSRINDLWIKKRWHQNDPYSAFAVFKKETNEFLGHVIIGYGKEPGEGSLAYFFMKKHWNQGFGTEAVTAMVKEYAPATLKEGYTLKGKPLEKITATARPDNPASIKILEKVGMHKTGEEIKYGALRHHFSINLNELTTTQQGLE